jgi:hypothetical protein
MQRTARDKGDDETTETKQSCTNPSFGCLLFMVFCVVCLTAWIGALLFWLAESGNERAEAGLDEVLEIEAGLDIDVNGTEEEVMAPAMPYNATGELVALRELYEQLKLECEVAARAHDESMSILGSSHDESMPRISNSRLVEEPTAFPTVTLKFEGETHRHGR